MNGIPPTTGAEIATWLACAAFVVGLLNQGARLIDRFRSSVQVRPDPASTYVPRTECDQYRKGVEGKVGAIEATLADGRRQRETDLSQIHGRLTEIGGRVSELTEASRNAKTQIAQLVDRLDRVLAARDSTPLR